MVSNEICKFLESGEFTPLEVVTKSIFSRLDIDSLYNLSDFDTHEQREVLNRLNQNNVLTHKENFVLKLVQHYMTMKSKSIGRKMTIEEDEERTAKRKARRLAILAGKSHVEKEEQELEDEER